MNFTFVNKNLLIPEIEIFENFDKSIQKLIDSAHFGDKNYNSNLYVVSSDNVYFSNGSELYSVSGTNNIEKIEISLPNKTYLNKINSFLSGCFDMDIDFNIKNSNDKIIIKNDKEQIETNKQIKNRIKNQNKQEAKEVNLEEKPEPIQKTKEELELISLYEEIMQIYQTELRKIKEIEKKIKILDCNRKNLLKKQKEKIFVNFSKLKGDYDTFKMINKKLAKNPDMEIPSLFILKYNYFRELMNICENQKLFKLLDELNLDEVLNKNIDIDLELQNFANDYGKDSKKLNVKFDHSWEDLELETDAFEMNNSKLGGI
jgi:hypothetical protein